MVKRDYNLQVLLLKQYLRWLPAQLGLLNYGAFRLQLRTIKKDDLFLVSYPKSGNTWLRYIVAAALHGRSDFSFAELEDIVPDVYLSKRRINRTKASRIIKTHDALFDHYPASVYIYRDMRDVMVSYYHYALNARQFSGTFSAFIRSNYIRQPFGTWAQHVNQAISARDRGRKIHLVKYETLLASPVNEIGAMLDFMQISPVIDAEKIAGLCAFGNLQSNEKNKGSYFGSDSLFFREGKNTSGANVLTQNDLDYLMGDRLTKQMMKQLQYI